MKKLTIISVAAASLLISGCATSDPGVFHQDSAASKCEPGTGGPGQSPCKMVYWSSRDGAVDPRAPENTKDDRR